MVIIDIISFIVFVASWLCTHIEISDDWYDLEIILAITSGICLVAFFIISTVLLVIWVGEYEIFKKSKWK